MASFINNDLQQFSYDFSNAWRRTILVQQGILCQRQEDKKTQLFFFNHSQLLANVKIKQKKIIKEPLRNIRDTANLEKSGETELGKVEKKR